MALSDLTEGMIDAGDNLFLDAQGNWQTVQEGSQGAANQWMWTDEGIVPLGGSTQVAITDPFLGIQEQYRGGAAIEADTWQEAASRSLEGFMRANYGTDPIFNWIPGESGIQNTGQFRMGTLQELANQMNIPGMFFDTTGPLARNINSGQIVDPNSAFHDRAPTPQFDPLLGFAPDDKFLGFEDIPLEQLEMLQGQMPGQIFIQDPNRASAAERRKAVEDEVLAMHQQWLHADADTRSRLENALKPKEAQLHQLTAELNNLPSPFISLADAQSRGDLQDFNDFIFKLNLEQYAEPDEIIQATPESVLKKFFDLPQYQLMYGDDPDVIDPTAGPHERFRADPGYQWAQDEGMRQIQRNSAAKGLLESGATQRDLQEYGQGMADQNYQRWLGQNSALYSDWQNQLRGLSSQGAGLSSQVGQQTLGTGFNLAGQGVQQGSNLANLFANQGSFGANAFLNTGAAQANTSMQAASLQAQLMAAQMSAQAASGGSSGGGAGEIISQIGGLIGGFM